MNGINLIQKLETQNLYINLRNQLKLKNLKILYIMSMIPMKRNYYHVISHLNEHKFRHGFDDTVNPICPCGTELETNEHFLLCCHCFSSQRSELFNNLYNLDPSFSKLNNKKKVTYLLY